MGGGGLSIGRHLGQQCVESDARPAEKLWYGSSLLSFAVKCYWGVPQVNA